MCIQFPNTCRPHCDLRLHLGITFLLFNLWVHGIRSAITDLPEGYPIVKIVQERRVSTSLVLSVCGEYSGSIGNSRTGPTLSVNDSSCYRKIETDFSNQTENTILGQVGDRFRINCTTPYLTRWNSTIVVKLSASYTPLRRFDRLPLDINRNFTNELVLIIDNGTSGSIRCEKEDNSSVAAEIYILASNNHEETDAATNIETNQNSTIITLVLSIGLPLLSVILIFTLGVVYVIRKRRRGSLIFPGQDYQKSSNGNASKNVSDLLVKLYFMALSPSLIIQKEDLTCSKILGSGEYGVVLKGILTKNGQDEKLVAVKTTKQGVDSTYVKAMVFEVKIMAYVGAHPNIVGFLGTCLEGLREGKIFVAVEFCENGDLLRRLRHEKEMLTTSVTLSNRISDHLVRFKKRNTFGRLSQGMKLSPSLAIKLVKWSQEIACGLDFISSKNVIHGDLAARNILLTKDNVAKISDFGLSRFTFKHLNDYNVDEKKNSVPLPWKWMSLEALTSSNFSLQSDIWAFGVTLWEIFSLGDVPYPCQSYNENFIHKLSAGFRPPKPEFACDEIFSAMQRCWETNPNLRPEASSVYSQFSVLLEKFQNNRLTRPNLYKENYVSFFSSTDEFWKDFFDNLI